MVGGSGRPSCEAELPWDDGKGYMDYVCIVGVGYFPDIVLDMVYVALRRVERWCVNYLSLISGPNFLHEQENA